MEIELPAVGLELQLPAVSPANGKRGPSAPLNLQPSSDEDEPKDTRTDERGSAFSPTLLDHDYENVSSPGSSSTASGPTYVRQPGFTQHAHEVIAKPKIKKKKTTELLSVKNGLRRREPTPPKNKPKRGRYIFVCLVQPDEFKFLIAIKQSLLIIEFNKP